MAARQMAPWLGDDGVFGGCWYPGRGAGGHGVKVRFWGCDPFVRRWLFLVFRICIFFGG